MIYTHQMDAAHKPTGPYAGPTADKRVRQALSAAIDADEIIKGVMDGKAVRVATMLPSLHFGYDASLKPVKQDLARSKKLLAEAGFPNGLEIVLNGPQGRYVRDKEVAEAVSGQLTKAGIKTTLRTFEFVNYLNNMVYVHKAGPVWLIGWGHPTMDAEAIYVPLFKSAEHLRELAQRGLQRDGGPGAVGDGREEAPRRSTTGSTSCGSRRSPRSRSISRSTSTGPTSGCSGRRAATS